MLAVLVVISVVIVTYVAKIDNIFHGCVPVKRRCVWLCVLSCCRGVALQSGGSEGPRLQAYLGSDGAIDVYVDGEKYDPDNKILGAAVMVQGGSTIILYNHNLECVWYLRYYKTVFLYLFICL